MKNNFYFLISILFLASELTLSQNYQLVWSDEFDGTELNINNWSRESGGSGWGNNELEYYTTREENSFVSNGALTIKALKESYGGRDYTSARLKTQGKKFFKYGKIEARIKLPYSQGIWPAFWTLGESINSVSWPACGEIDIMEMIGGSTSNNSDKKTYGTLHWDQSGHASYGGNYTLSSGIFADDFHTFGIIWDPEKITWYVDDVSFFSMDITSQDLDEFQKEQFIILNVAVGGAWPGNPNSTTVFPQTMEVDYVRVYQDVSQLPDINIITPIDNSKINPGDNLTINADVKFEGKISRVEFYQDAVKIGETIFEPYEMNLSNVSSGCYNVYAIAYTDKGFSSKSASVNFKVGSDCVEGAYQILPAKIPGEIEAENFNLGGQGIAYYDNDASNSGGAYRITEGVDIQECTDEGGGYNVGYINPNEWINYFVDVKEMGVYNIEVRAASNNTTGGAFHVEFDGVDKTGSVNVPNTNGWQNWTTVTAENISLTAGVHTMNIFFELGNININKFGIYHPNSTPEIELLSPNGGESWQVGSVQEIKWNSVKVSDVKIGLSTNGGSSWSFVSNKTTSAFGVYRWKISDTPSDNCLIQIVNNNDFSVTGKSSDKFIITNTTDVNENKTSIQKFSLSQNYPNPFNPTTKIKYTIPYIGTTHSLSVRINVYNMLGKEIATLVNEKESPGEYEVEFDGSSLPSGIYYYRLQSGEFNETKKLVLLK